MSDKPHIIIDKEGKIIIPKELKNLAVQFEHGVKTVTFDCPRFTWDGQDLTEMVIFVNVEEKPDPVSLPCKNVIPDENDPDLMHFDWTITREATLKAGKFKFSVCAKNVNKNDGMLEEHWLSQNCEDAVILPGIDCYGTLTEQYPDLATYMLASINTLEISRVAKKWYGKSFIVFGTSLTSQCPNFDGGYLEIVKNRCGFASYTNEGKAGSPLVNNTRNGNGHNYRIKNTDLSPYDLIIIEGSATDFKLDVPIGEVGKMGDANDITTFSGALRDSIEHIIRTYPHKRILLIADHQHNNNGYDVNHVNAAGHKLIDYIDAMTAVGELYGIHVVDWYRKSGINALNLHIHTVDGIHLNTNGYSMVGELTASEVEVYTAPASFEEAPVAKMFYEGLESDIGILKAGDSLDLVFDPRNLSFATGYAWNNIRLDSEEYWNIKEQTGRATSVGNVLCGNFDGKTVGLSSYALSTGTTVRFALLYKYLNSVNGFSGTQNIGELPFAWLDHDVVLPEDPHLSNVRVLIFVFMNNANVDFTPEELEELKNLIYIV